MSVPATPSRAYAVCSGAGRVTAIDTAAHEAIGEVAVGDEPMLAALSPDGATLLVTNANSRDVTVIDTATLTATRTVAVGDGAAGCAFSPDGSRAYVANEHDHSVSVLDARSWQEIGRAAVGRTPCEIVVIPGGRELAVSNEASSTVGVLDGLTGEQRRFVVTPEGPIGLALTPDASTLLVGCYGSNHVFCLETARWTIRWRAAVGGNHVGLCATPDGRRALVTNADGDTISVLDLETRREVSRVRVGPGPATVAMLPGQDRLAYVTIRGADSVSVVDLTEERVVGSIRVGASPLGLCIGTGGPTRAVRPPRRDVRPASRRDARVEPRNLVRFPGEAVKSGPSANSFNFELVETPPVRLPGFTPTPHGGGCTAFGLELRGPAVRSVLLVEPGGAALYRTPTADFSDEAIAAVKLEVEQLYLDVTPEGGDEPLFPSNVRRLRLHPECRGCADRGRCCCAVVPDEGENPFRREESWIRAELSRVRGRVLDVGCGELPYREELQRLIEAGQVEYVGLDPDAGALERLRAVWGFRGDLRRGEIESFDAERGAFDYVLAFRSLNHFRDVELAFSVISRVLRPGGQLLICDSPVFALLRTHAQVERADRRAGGVHEHYRSWTSHEAMELLRRFPLRLNLHRPVTAETANQWALKYLRRPDGAARRGARG